MGIPEKFAENDRLVADVILLTKDSSLQTVRYILVNDENQTILYERSDE